MKKDIRLKCPLGHEQKSRSGYVLHPDVIVRTCNVCGILFDPLIAHKFNIKDFKLKKTKKRRRK